MSGVLVSNPRSNAHKQSTGHTAPSLSSRFTLRSSLKSGRISAADVKEARLSPPVRGFSEERWNGK